jgi:hypothetical protein
MTTDCALADILDEAIIALRDFDLGKLVALEQRITLLAQINVKHQRDEIGALRTKRHQLQILLQNTRTNLDTLTRLHARNTRNPWAQSHQ